MTLNPADQWLASLSHHVESSGRFSEQYRASQPSAPIPGAPAATEFVNDEHGPGGPWGSGPVSTAHQIADLFLVASQAHLYALGRLLSPPLIPFSFEVIERVAVEASGRAWWLLEPGLTVRQRVERTWTERLHDAREQDKTIRTFLASDFNAEFGDLQGRLEYSEPAVHDQARALGLEPRLTRKGVITCFGGLPRPASTNLSKTFLADAGIHNGDVAYRVGAGVVHSTQVGILQSYRQCGTDPVTGDLQMEEAVSLTSCWKAVAMAESAHSCALRRRAVQYGWDLPRLDGHIRAAHQHLVGPLRPPGYLPADAGPGLT